MAATKRSRNARAQEIASFEDSKTLLSEVKQLKTDSNSNLDNLLKQFVSSCERNGSKVAIAKTGQDVVNYVLDLALQHKVKLIDKSNSLTCVEIELNHFIELKGIEIIETVVGERIFQLA